MVERAVLLLKLEPNSIKRVGLRNNTTNMCRVVAEGPYNPVKVEPEHLQGPGLYVKMVSRKSWFFLLRTEAATSTSAPRYIRMGDE